MSGLTETERLKIRNSILATLTELDQKDAALATALSHTLAPVVARMVADAWDEGWQHYSKNPFPQAEGFGVNPYRGGAA